MTWDGLRAGLRITKIKTYPKFDVDGSAPDSEGQAGQRKNLSA